MPAQQFNPELVDETPQYTLGAVLWDDDGKAWAYVEAATALTAHYVAGWQADGAARAITSAQSTTWNHMFFAGMPVADIPAGSYGWCQVYGPCRFKVASSYAVGASAYTTTTAGQVDDSGSHKIRRLAPTAVASGYADGIAIFPSSHGLT